MKFNKVPDRQKPAFPGKHFNDPIFDIKVFNIADKIIKGYGGGRWDYILTDTDVAFMYLNEVGESVLINPFSGEEISAPNVIAGMIVTSYALLLQIEKGRSTDALIKSYSALNTAIAEYCAAIDRTDIWFAMMD